MKDRILALLAAGLPPVMVASAIGVEASYVSQLLADPLFAAEVASKRVAELESMRARDAKYDGLEDSFLEKLESLLPMMYKPRDVLTALQMVNAAKRRSAEIINPVQSQATINNVVVLQLPAKIVNTFELNKQNEVVSIDDKALVAMPTQALMKLVSVSNESERELPNEQTPATPTERTTRQIPFERRLTEDSI
jgi:hypothetical protein